MPVDYGYLLVGAIAVHSVVLAAAALSVRKAKRDRTRILWKLLVLETVVFPIAATISYYLQPTTSWLTATADIVYSTVVAFVLGVEVPGFLLLTKFDERIATALEEVRKDLVVLGYSFDHLAQFKATVEKNKERLGSAGIDGLVDDFVLACDRMNNLDRSFWGLLLSEVTTASRTVAERSKHPFPKLIDVMSLAGLSFLLAQFLKLLG
jgi:hypothetical protein